VENPLSKRPAPDFAALERIVRGEEQPKPVHRDAFHSFQDPILPIAEFQAQYGDRLVALGGIDIDKLCWLDEASLRQYMRDILDQCMTEGRFVFGSGKTISRYVPVDHHLWTIEESRRWGAG
jgi:uroporphyrinogen decarboxylase